MFSVLAALSLCGSAMAQAPAFPGAEGNGRYTTGGRGGKIVHVTNLNDNGTGSLRAAVNSSSAKTIVFDVGGVIALESDLTIGANTTILGQTAPYPGITLRYYTVRPGANNIIRFIRVRRGQEKDVNDGADAIWNRNLTNVIIDHCSFSWSIDEVASFYDNNNFTMQWCTVGESLNNAGHGKVSHGYGGIWGGKLASFHHNMIAHVNNRAPRFNGARYNWTGYTDNTKYATYNWENAVQAENVDFRNCLVFDWGGGECYGGPGGGYINMVNNYFKPTEETTKKNRLTLVSVANSTTSTDENTYLNMASRYYINGNYVNGKANYDWSGVSFDSDVQTIDGERYTIDSLYYYGTAVEHVNNSMGIPCVKIKLDNETAPAGDVTTHSAENAYAKILSYGGASFFRDDVDARYMSEAESGTSTYTGSVTGVKGRIDLVSDVDGYTESNFPTGRRGSDYDSDNDGMPDAWETVNGLNPDDAADALTYFLDSKGYYTNLEVFANSLVEKLVKAANTDAESTVDEYYPTVVASSEIEYYTGRIVERVSQVQEKELYSTTFTEWENLPATTVETQVTKSTKYSHESLSFSIFNTQVSSTNQNTTKFPAWTDGYMMSEKSDNPYVITSALASITKVCFRHGATGSNRGWRLEAKGDGDADWVVLSDATASTATGTDVSIEVNRTNCQLRFTNLNSKQNAYLFKLTIYGNVDMSGTPALATFAVNGTTYQAADIFSEAPDGTQQATIELSKSEPMVSDSNPLTDIMAENGEVGTVTYTTSGTGTVATIPVIDNGDTVNYIATFVQKPDFTLTYYDTDGQTVIGIQTVEKDAAIGSFQYSGADATVAEGRKFRGWFTAADGSGNRKFTVSDVITANTALHGIATELEVQSTTKRYTFDLTDQYFYDEDHEAFNLIGNGKFHDGTHGWQFANGDSLQLLVGGNAYIITQLCRYGGTASIKLVNSNGETLTTITSPADTDAEPVSYYYEGPADVLTMVFSGTPYIHGITIANVQDQPVAKNSAGYYIVKAGDADNLLTTIEVANANSSTERTYIFVPKGTYHLGEKALTAISGNNISIIGEDRDATIIVNAPKVENEGIATTATFLISGQNTYFQDVTLQNALDYYASGAAGRAVVIQDKGTRTICKNVKMLSYQDTYYSNNAGQYYFEDGEIHGTVDYICGNGDVYFNRVTLVNESRSVTDNTGEDVIAAPYPSDNIQFGYVFNDCTIKTNSASFSLGRSWGGLSKLAYLNTTISEPSKLKDTRFTTAGMNTAAYSFKEYASVDGSGNVITPASNVLTFSKDNTSYTYNTTLSADSAKLFTIENVFADWAPQTMTAQASMSNANLSDGTISWNAVANAPGYAIFADGTFVDIIDGTSFAAQDGVQTYTIKAANIMGGFGEAVSVTTATGIADNTADSVTTSTFYSINGIKLNKAQRGVNIRVNTLANGKSIVEKVVVK